MFLQRNYSDKLESGISYSIYLGVNVFMHGGLRTYNNLYTVSAIKLSPDILGFIRCIPPVFNFFGLNVIGFH